MRTRRKSKAAAAAAAAAEPDNEAAESVAPVEGSTAGSFRAEFSVPIPEDLDIGYLSRLLPDFSFETPSPDAVLSLYRFVVSQAVDLDAALRDLEESRAEAERKDVELDQAYQDRESSVSSLEAQVKSFQEELAKVKEERNTLGKSEATPLDGYPCYDILTFFPVLKFKFLLLSVIQKQFRVANNKSEQFAILLLHGARLCQAQGGRHRARKT